MNGAISFDTNNLQTYTTAAGVGILTNVINHTSIPDKIAQLFAKADADQSSIPTINYPSKKISIAGMIKGDDQGDLDDRIDTFKGYFTGKDKNLDIAYGSSTRRYIATANSVSVVRKDKALFATFQIEFICTNPFGLDTTATNLWTAKTAFSSSTFTETPTIGGNAPFQQPVITITLNTITGTGDYILVSNDNTNQEMLIYGVGFADDDVLIIDSAERTVTLNGTPVDYYGTFIELAPGASSITYTDGFDTRDVDVEGVYTKRWL